jgi:hypothetical protein
MMEGIYEVSHGDGLRCNDILVRIKFPKDRLRHSLVNGGGGVTDTQTCTDSMVISYAYFHFLKIRKIG